LTSPSESLCRKLAASATWRAKSLSPQSWRRALRKARWTTLLSGLTCDDSTVARGVARWMESLAVSLVRISPSLASEPESKGSAAACGRSSLELLGRFDPAGYSLRTSQVSLLTGRCAEFLETFPRSGSMRNGRVYEHRMSAPPTSGSGCSSWPTAQAADAAKWHKRKARTGRQQNLSGAALNWPTPDTGESQSGHGVRGGPGGGDVGKQAVVWSAPEWYTPQTPGGGRSVGVEIISAKGRTATGEKRTVGLESQARWWPTPAANAATGPGRQGRNGGPNLQTAACSLPDQPIQPGGTCWCGRPGCDLQSHKRKLNPLFVAWLMGWPIWWCITEPMPCAHSEMESYLCRQRSRLRTLLDAGGTDEPRHMD